MLRHVAKTLTLFVAILVVGTALHTPLAGNELAVNGYDVEGRTINVSVTNRTAKALSGSVEATVTHNGETHKASVSVRVAAGQTTTISIIVGSITDDINPLDYIHVGTIVDDINPQ